MRCVGASQRLGQLPRRIQAVGAQHLSVHAGQPAAGQRVQEFPVVGAQRQRFHDAGMEQHGGAEDVQHDIKVRHMRHVATAFGHIVDQMQRFPGSVQGDRGVRIGGECAAGRNGGGDGMRWPIRVGGVAQRAGSGLEQLF